MRITIMLAALGLVGLARCESALVPSGDLTGRWGWASNSNPGGSSITLTLAAAGNVVSGTGAVCGIGPTCSPGPVTVAGTTVPGFARFNLTITGSGGFVATYAGQAVGADQLQGTWTEGSQSNASVIFNRCTSSSYC
jgi:hypothetical protein